MEDMVGVIPGWEEQSFISILS